MHPALTKLISHDGVIDRRAHPTLATRIDYAARRGELTRLLPCVYARGQDSLDWRTLVRALAMWDPSAVICREAAAALTFWTDLVPSTVEVATNRRLARAPSTALLDLTSPPNPRMTIRQRSVPPALVATRSRIRVTAPALTAIDLIDTHGSDVIDIALRSRLVTLGGLDRALHLTSRRRGNVDRRRALLDSRTEPWSALERLAHRHLRAAGITKWRANVPIICGERTYHQDIAMKGVPLTIELDGYEHHSSRSAFEHDRRRGNSLMLAGRHVLHFTWEMVHHEPRYFVETVRDAMRQLAPARAGT